MSIFTIVTADVSFKYSLTLGVWLACCTSSKGQVWVSVGTVANEVAPTDVCDRKANGSAVSEAVAAITDAEGDLEGVGLEALETEAVGA